MLYYIYIGNSQTAIDHLSKVTNGMFVTVSGARKAAKIIDGIRERYNTSILYEQTDTEKDCLDITCLHKRFPRVYIILITEGLPAEARKTYLQAGVNNTLPPQADETSIHRMTQFLQVRQKHKMQEFSQSHRKMLNTFHLPAWKRAFDILFAICALIILSPLLIGTAIAIRLESKGKVIYKSQRVGSNYRIFNFLKFRSMYTNADKRLKELNALNQYKIEEELTDEQPDIRFDDLTGTSEEEATLLISDDFVISEEDFLKKKAQEKQNTFVKIENDPRVTRVGRFIRKYSIDELPQLFNVLKGDMSLVGPRPERPQFVEKFREEIPRYMVKHQVRPGMTGWAQINGYRGDTSIKRRIEFDLYYIENWTVGLDIKILILTIFKGFINKNAY